MNPIHSGVSYYIDKLAMDANNYRLHFSFNQNSGLNVLNSCSGFNQMSGVLSSVGNFYSAPTGSGFFTGQSIAVDNSSGMISNEFTYIFQIYKTGSGAAILADCFLTGTPNSGYCLGITDSNRLFFESYDANGPFVKIDSTILGQKNISAITKSSNAISFYTYNYNNDSVLSSSYSINGNFIPSTSKCRFGRHTSNNPSFLQTGIFKGYVDEIIYFSESLTPFTFKYIVSGLFSNISQSNIISGYSVNEITGFAYQLTGVSGITGFQNIVTGSGLSSFDTGSYDFYYTTSGITGFITTGLQLISLSGLVTYFSTGDLTTSITFNSGLITDYSSLEEVSYLRKIDYKDLTNYQNFNQPGSLVNNLGQYDNVRGQFQLNNIYIDNNVNIFANGQALNYQGYIPTGTFYSSGNLLSGDFIFNGFYIDCANFFSGVDTIIYDNLSGFKQYSGSTGNYSGQILNIPISGYENVFLNGQLLTSGIDYYASGSQFVWNNSYYSGYSGKLFIFPTQYSLNRFTGIFPPQSRYLRGNSLLWLNGIRETINIDYIENSVNDLINNSGLFATNLDDLYLNYSGYFEN